MATIDRLSRVLGIPPSDVIALAMDEIETQAGEAGTAAEKTGEKFNEAGDAGVKFAEDLEQLAVSLMDANRALEDMVTPFETIGRNQGALQAVFDIGNAPEVAAGKVRDVKLAIGELDTALEGIDVGAVLAGDISADKFLDAIDAIAPDIQAQITDTFAAGGPAAAIEMANSYIDQVTAELGRQVQPRAGRSAARPRRHRRQDRRGDRPIDAGTGATAARDPHWGPRRRPDLGRRNAAQTPGPECGHHRTGSRDRCHARGGRRGCSDRRRHHAAIAKADAARRTPTASSAPRRSTANGSLAKARADAAKTYADALVATETDRRRRGEGEGEQPTRQRPTPTRSPPS